MADEDNEERKGEDTTAKEPQKNNEDTPAEPKISTLKLILIMMVPVVLIGIALAGLFLTTAGRNLLGLDHHPNQGAVAKLPANIIYYEMPELLINIQSSAGKRKPYLRLAVKFELHDSKAVDRIELIKPRIIDSFQVYLRELRVEDIDGSAGSQRLKEELLRRVNTVAAPAKIHDVLFQVFVVQ